VAEIYFFPYNQKNHILVNLTMLDNTHLIGNSESFLSVLDHVTKIAPLNRPVLILGERGTGKELIAKRIHYLSLRWNQSLVTLNCAALAEGIIDSELFGHEAGSFSGAKNKHKGRFERAEGGTLFLDELGTAPVQVQEKLLRVIKYGEYERVGGSQKKLADVRLICATNQDLLALVEQGNFRADLLDRLTFDIIHLPPLRKRQEDILLLSDYFGQKMCAELGFDYFCGFSDSIKSALKLYPWPGNIRELKNVIERAVYRHGKQNKPIDHLDFNPFIPSWEKSESTELKQVPTDAKPRSELAHSPKMQSFLSENVEKMTNKIAPSSLEQISTETISFPFKLRPWQHAQEKTIVSHAMRLAKFNQAQAAQLLGLSYHQLRGLLRKHQLMEE
jgi:psp operon transcriptional activator